jgi:hypothetical protein
MSGRRTRALKAAYVDRLVLGGRSEREARESWQQDKRREKRAYQRRAR